MIEFLGDAPAGPTNARERIGTGWTCRDFPRQTQTCSPSQWVINPGGRSGEFTSVGWWENTNYTLQPTNPLSYLWMAIATSLVLQIFIGGYRRDMKPLSSVTLAFSSLRGHPPSHLLLQNPTFEEPDSHADCPAWLELPQISSEPQRVAQWQKVCSVQAPG